MLVCVKQAGLVSEADRSDSLPDLLVRQAETEGRELRLFAVHRLDKEVGGVMVYAKTSAAAAALSRCIAAGSLEKRYLAVVCGRPQIECDTLCDLLYHDRAKNKTFVVKRERRGVKKASLEYRAVASEVAEKCGDVSLLDVRLHTGRTHQIRVQFASRRLPLWGDPRYGGVGRDMGLWSYLLRFPHPTTGETVTFIKKPSAEHSAFGAFASAVDNV